MMSDGFLPEDLGPKDRMVKGMDDMKVDMERMKKSAFLVNTSRGPIVNETDLLEAANKGLFRGVAMDVFAVEPLPKESKWRDLGWGKDGKARVLLTPHMGYVEEEVIGEWYVQQVENIKKWRKGEALTTEFMDSGY